MNIVHKPLISAVASMSWSFIVIALLYFLNISSFGLGSIVLILFTPLGFSIIIIFILGLVYGPLCGIRALRSLRLVTEVSSRERWIIKLMAIVGVTLGLTEIAYFAISVIR